MINYYFAAASKKFLVTEEPTEEILRERTQYYLNNNKAIDFWIVDNPKFLQKKEFLEFASKIPKPLTVIISTDKRFIDWIKLRIVYVKTGNISIPPYQENDLLNSNN
uniref:Ycf54 n=1 Tax=Sciadococcus taiwanensis TaxID=3028030 RepID=A0A9Y1I238_9RHOD|nr:hypothetical protein SCTW_076 [Sciadococcus taiwanensis]